MVLCNPFAFDRVLYALKLKLHSCLLIHLNYIHDNVDKKAK